MIEESSRTLGAVHLGDDRASFRLWAPRAERVDLRILTPTHRTIPMERQDGGYHQRTPSGVELGSRYLFCLDGGPGLPDPCSRRQPEGVHGPSEIVSLDFDWHDGHWHGIPLASYLIYELHVGTFTRAGDFDAVVPHLDRLVALGVNAIELMPVAQFPGERNWGYDGVYPFAVQQSYGGVEGLARLVDAAHAAGLAVILDVVYNHLGPEGNYLGKFAPYFTDRYQTPWGPALNFDGPDSDEVRCYFIENALYWVDDLHVDALRLDAVHAILDVSPHPFLAELAEAVHRRAEELNRHIHLFPESAANDPRLVRVPELGGYGLDAQWNDDFHHSLHVLLTGEATGYYADFGEPAQLGKALQEGFVYSGEYSDYRHRRHGASSEDIPPERFVVFSQNHDQVGNRMKGERLPALVDHEKLKLAAGVVLLSSNLPLLFMGEEYAETAPFPYFVSHSDPDLIEAVRRGRREEFRAFDWEGEPPDPQDASTFESAKLNHELADRGYHRVLRSFYQELIGLRRNLRPLRRLSKRQQEITVTVVERVLFCRRWDGAEHTLCCFHFGGETATVSLELPAGRWRKELDSAEPRWEGPGSALPSELGVSGETVLELAPWSVGVFSRR